MAGRLPAGANFLMLMSFVLPEVLLAVALLFVITTLVLPIQLGTTAQVIGLVTFQVSYPAVLVRARLATIGPQYEEAAMDLGASPLGALRRIILPMLMPAIFASTVLVFADVIDDFVMVRYLSGDASTEPVSVKIYNTARGAPTPALNALATLLLLFALTAVVSDSWCTGADAAGHHHHRPRHRSLRRRGVNPFFDPPRATVFAQRHAAPGVHFARARGRRARHLCTSRPRTCRRLV